jgi:hypothetical protein
VGVGFGSGGGAGDVTGCEKDNPETQGTQRFSEKKKTAGINPACGKQAAATQGQKVT